MSLREGLGGYAIRTPASTSLPPAQAEQRASTAPKQHWSTQYSPAGSSPQTPFAYPYPDLSQTSFNSPALQPSPVFDSGSQRTPSKTWPSAARHVYGTHDSRLDPRSPSQPLSRGPSSVYQNANPEHTPPTCNTPESQFPSTPPPRNVPNGNVGDITKFAGPPEHQKIDPSLLPAPQGSPPASKAIKVNLSQSEASIAVEVSPRKPEAQIHPGGSMGGNADLDKREKGLNQAKKIARTDRRKANKIVRPQVPDPRQSIARTHPVRQATQIVDPVHDEGHRPKRLKGNPRAPEDGKGYWCPDPDCPVRRKSIPTIEKHVTSNNHHLAGSQPTPRTAPGSEIHQQADLPMVSTSYSEVLQRPHLPKFCQQCHTSLNDWQHSWRHIRGHQQDGMVKKNYLIWCRSYSRFLYTFHNEEVENPDWYFELDSQTNSVRVQTQQ
jgi:hypothetical protein